MNKPVFLASSLVLAGLLVPILGAQAAHQPDNGKAIYELTCVACHGQRGKGVMSGIPDFNKSNGPLSKADDLLLKSILEGSESPGAMLAMPEKGSNPDLSPHDAEEVLKYIRGSFGGS